MKLILTGVMAVLLLASCNAETFHAKPCSGKFIRIPAPEGVYSVLLSPPVEYVKTGGELLLPGGKAGDIVMVMAKLVDGEIILNAHRIVISDTEPVTSIRDRVLEALKGYELDDSILASIKNVRQNVLTGKTQPIQSLNLLSDLATQLGQSSFETVRTVLTAHLSDSEITDPVAISAAFGAVVDYLTGEVN